MSYLTPSLFVYIRKRLGDDDFDKMNQKIIAKKLNINIEENIKDYEKSDDKQLNF